MPQQLGPDRRFPAKNKAGEEIVILAHLATSTAPGVFDNEGKPPKLIEAWSFKTSTDLEVTRISRGRYSVDGVEYTSVDSNAV